MSELTTSWVVDAIQSAQDRGMVPFVAVIPVSPEFLANVAGPADEFVGQAASEAISKQVREWQSEHLNAANPAADPPRKAD
jgi:hypothetical protein